MSAGNLVKLILLIFLVALLIIPPGCRRRSNSFVIALGDNIRTIDPMARLRWKRPANACVR